MQLVIKVLKGQDCTLNVETDTTIFQIKKEIEKILNIPILNQKLLFIGRTLNDSSSIENYPQIKDGSKLNLVVARTELNVREVVYRTFRKHYNEGQAENFSRQFVDEFQRSLKQCNLNDLERMAEFINRSEQRK